MREKLNTLISQLLELPVRERIRAAEQLLISVDHPTKSCDQSWVEECESRLDAYTRGEISAVSASQVLGDHL